MKRSRNRFFWDSYDLRIAGVSALVLFVALMGVLIYGTCLWTSALARDSRESLDKGIAADEAYLVAQGNAASRSPQLHEAIASSDPARILSVLRVEKDARNIGLMSFADARGTIISRTRTASSTGENTFLISPQGRALKRGSSDVSSVEVSSFDPTQLIMTTGRHVTEGDAKIGAVFANYLMDDAYAQRFVGAYLHPGVEILFYTKGHGIYGSSIVDPSVRQTVASYFNVDSDWIRSGKTGTIIRFDDGSYYRVENVVFPGLEHSPGGALILVPYHGYSIPVRVAIIIVSISLFLFVALKRKPAATFRNRYYYWSVFTFAFAAFIVMVILARASFVPYAQLRKVPYILYNSTMRLQPEAGVFDSRFERSFAILVDTGSEQVNAVSAVLAYDPDVVDVTSLDTESSFCTHFLEKAVDVAHGQIRVVCDTVPPGFSGSSGIVATVFFRSKKAASADFSFTDETEVLANDGLGTNVLRMATNGNYRFMENIDAAQLATSSSARTAAPANLTPIIHSSTHSNSGRWYNSRNIELFWMSSATTTEFVYALDESPTTILSEGARVGETKLRIVAPHDGIFYFHVAPVIADALGPTRHYKVMIDTAPPKNVSIRSSADVAEVGDIIRFEFDAEDAESGLQNTMYVDIDDSGLFLPVGKQTYVPFTDPGSIPIKLRVYDKAGNYAQVEKHIEVSGKPAQWLIRNRY